MKQFESIEEMLAYYFRNPADTGSKGKAFESLVRNELRNELSMCRPAGKTDIVVKRGIALESKTGCGWIVSPILSEGIGYATQADAQAAIDSMNFHVCRATHFVYSCDGTLENARVFSQKQFLSIWAEHGKLRTKYHRDSGLWGITIQTWIPTETWKGSKKVYASILSSLSEGLTLAEYAERYLSE